MLSDGLIEGELIDCADCGVELEVARLQPSPVLREAPAEAEDWGE
jgi:alpha-aminoadipate carrier protein LysW